MADGERGGWTFLRNGSAKKRDIIADSFLIGWAERVAGVSAGPRVVIPPVARRPWRPLTGRRSATAARHFRRIQISLTFFFFFFFNLEIKNKFFFFFFLKKIWGG